MCNVGGADLIPSITQISEISDTVLHIFKNAVPYRMIHNDCNS